MISEAASIREKILKLLALTASDNDGEALNACRMANAILKKNGLSWGAFIDPYIPQGDTAKRSHDDPRENPREPEDVWDLIEYVRDNAWPGFDFSFIDTIERRYDQTGRLTPGQLRALRNIYDNIRVSLNAD